MATACSEEHDLPQVSEPLAKKPRVQVDVVDLSGKSLVQLDVIASMTGIELKAEVGKHLDPCQYIQELIFHSVVLNSSTLIEAGLVADGSSQIVNVVVGSRPALHMFKPCSAAELANRYVELNDFGEVSEIPVFKEPIQFMGMDKASLEAQRIANELSNALGTSLAEMFPSPFGGFLDGQVIAISGVGSDLKKTCCEALGGINACAWNDDLDDEEDVWEDVCCTNVDYSKVDDCPFVYEVDAENLSENVMECAHAGQKVMAESLSKHFLFDFDCDKFKLFPEIYGGFASDGSIVGIMRANQMDA
eukprot:TRINITY_DN58517_c0_g1_i1.p1 TRINITY_DN58517_c0_g1~~TRINITY_DN58517_c0_g1_i1.p1  ORF type:complete len:328 (-),score=55.40 TRINITY_DN58517_c0_g1_i1:190-1101(-)